MSARILHESHGRPLDEATFECTATNVVLLVAMPDRHTAPFALVWGRPRLLNGTHEFSDNVNIIPAIEFCDSAKARFWIHYVSDRRYLWAPLGEQSDSFAQFWQRTLLISTILHPRRGALQIRLDLFCELVIHRLTSVLGESGIAFGYGMVVIRRTNLGTVPRTDVAPRALFLHLR